MSINLFKWSLKVKFLSITLLILLVPLASIGLLKEVEKTLVKAGSPLLESVQVFDVYRGEKIAAGNIAFGVRLNFRSAERTLTDEEVDSVVDRMITKLQSDLEVTLRS